MTKMKPIRTFLAIIAMAMAIAANAQEFKPSLPSISGTVRAKYEYEPDIEKGRFEVRNARVSVTGDIIPHLTYKAEIDLSDEGKIKMLDAYARYKPSNWSVTAGQMRVPFTIDAHRSPHQQYFANRSFIAKQVGNVRDVGLVASWSPMSQWTIEGGVFNGSGLTDQKDYWTGSYNFSLKTYATLADYFTVEMSCQRIRPDAISIMMWDAGAYYQDSRWHIEGEYLRKVYAHGSFPGVNAVDAFVAHRFPLKSQSVTGISALARYDYMSDHSDGKRNAEGILTVSDNERHRATFGATLHLGSGKFYADLRLNYEEYFYPHSPEISISGHSKLVLEIMCRF